MEPAKSIQRSSTKKKFPRRSNRYGADFKRIKYEHGRPEELMVKFRRSDVLKVLPDRHHVRVHVTGTVGTTTFEGVDHIRVIP